MLKEVNFKANKRLLYTEDSKWIEHVTDRFK